MPHVSKRRGDRIATKRNKRPQKPKTIWHPSFFASLQLELQDYREHLDFTDEINLNRAPRRIDAIVVVLRDSVRIEKNIARIFRKYNIFEYKSPDTSLTVNDYYNGLSYALQYKSIEANAAGIDDITLSFVCFEKPAKLFDHVGTRNPIHNIGRGIYAIGGNQVPVQIIVNGELDKGENIYLGCLRKHLDVESIIRLEDASRNVPAEVYSNYLEAVTTANIQRYMEVLQMKAALQAALKSMGKEERDKVFETAEQLIVTIGLDKKWEEALEAERRARDEALENERRARDEERRAKDEERRAKDEIQNLTNRIKELELLVAGK